jgi:hypothetical protein
MTGANREERSFSDKETGLVLETVSLFPKLSREELVLTICENLSWFTPSGGLKRDACLKALWRLEKQGLLTVPASRCTSAKPHKLEISPRTRLQPEISGNLGELKPVDLVPVSNREDKRLWNEFVQRYHPLGYRRPFGVRQRFFIVGGGRELGCFLVSGAAKSIAVRDRWIGWSLSDRRRNLHLVLNNSRYLVFPWVRVKFLASHVLAIAERRLAVHWQKCWGYRPVLLETMVTPELYSGTCYRAANWQYLGDTAGTGRPIQGQVYETTPKSVFVRPLSKDYQQRLRAS